MTQEQKASFINAQTAMMQAEMNMMLAENQNRLNNNESLAYTEDQFLNFMQRWEPILGYNSLILFFNS